MKQIALQGTVLYPIPAGTFESMIFRTSRLVGYVIVPRRVFEYSRCKIPNKYPLYKVYMGLIITPQKTNIDPKNDGFE